jgi:hypothetical protein
MRTFSGLKRRGTVRWGVGCKSFLVFCFRKKYSKARREENRERRMSEAPWTIGADLGGTSVFTTALSCGLKPIDSLFELRLFGRGRNLSFWPRFLLFWFCSSFGVREGGGRRGEGGGGAEAQRASTGNDLEAEARDNRKPLAI